MKNITLIGKLVHLFGNENNVDVLGKVISVNGNRVRLQVNGKNKWYNLTAFNDQFIY